MGRLTKILENNSREYLVSGTVGEESFSYRVLASNDHDAKVKAREQLNFKFSRKFLMKNRVEFTEVKVTGHGDFEEN